MRRLPTVARSAKVGLSVGARATVGKPPKRRLVHRSGGLSTEAAKVEAANVEAAKVEAAKVEAAKVDGKRSERIASHRQP